MVKHAELSKGQSVGLRILAVVLALIVGGIFIAAIGYNPFEIYATMITGCFRSPMAMQATVTVSYTHLDVYKRQAFARS